MKTVNGTPYLDKHPVSTSKDIAEYKEDIYREWWNVPYIVDGEVWCLDGGAWDRPHYLGLEGELLEIYSNREAYRKHGKPFRREFAYTDTFKLSTFADGETRTLTESQIMEQHCWFLPDN